MTYFTRINEEMSQIYYRERLRNSIYPTEREQAKLMRLSQFSLVHLKFIDYKNEMLREKSITMKELKSYLTNFSKYKHEHPDQLVLLSDLMILETGLMRMQILCKLSQLGKHKITPEILS